MDFLAIDFETACGNPNSACQLGAVIVRNGEIAEEHCWLIRPPRLYFSPRNIAIHGIRPRHVAEAPSMAQVWELLAEKLDNYVLLAHNARFDIHVLVSSLRAHDIVCPHLEFSCTRALARAAWPGRSGYGLKPLGESLGIPFQHHDALEDARCCARIALAIAEQCGDKSLAELELRLRLKRGCFSHGRIVSPIALGRKRGHLPAGRTTTDKWGFPAPQAARVGDLDANAVLRAADNGRPLEGKRIVLLGPLRGLSWEATRQLIQELGGHWQDQITSHTDFVVACGTTLQAASQLVCSELASPHNEVPEHHLPAGPPAKAVSDSAAQTGIRLLSERQFRALLPGGKAARW